VVSAKTRQKEKAMEPVRNIPREKQFLSTKSFQPPPVLLEPLEPRLLLSANVQELGLSQLGLVGQDSRPVLSVPHEQQTVPSRNDRPLAAPTDNNDQISEAIHKGSVPPARAHAGTISPGTDVDIFSFDVSAGRRIAIDIDRPSGSSLDSYIRLFRSNGMQLASNNDGAGPGEGNSGESYLEYTFIWTGLYYVGVSGNPNSTYDPVTGTGGSSGNAGWYSLILTDLNASSPVPSDAESPMPSGREEGLRGTQALVEPPDDQMRLIDVLSEAAQSRSDLRNYSVSPQQVSHIQDLWTVMSELQSDSGNGVSGDMNLNALARESLGPIAAGESGSPKGEDAAIGRELLSVDLLATLPPLGPLNDTPDDAGSPAPPDVAEVLRGPLVDVDLLATAPVEHVGQE